MELTLYGLPEVEDHSQCQIAAFCRNPLHPGPCKGWKRTLGAVAPGILRQQEEVRLKRVADKREARRKAAESEGRKAPRFRKLKHEREAEQAKKTGPRDGDGDGKVREGEDEPTGGRKGGGEREPVKVRGDVQRADLGRLLRAGDTGMPMQGMPKKRRDWLLENGFAEQRGERLYITPHGERSYDASLPRRNGELIGWDGKTDSERKAAEEEAKGAERRRLAAEREAAVVRGIPEVDTGDFLGGTGVTIRASDTARKLASLLAKDLGETKEDWAADVSPAAREWYTRTLEAERRAHLVRRAAELERFLGHAAEADPDNAEAYKARAAAVREQGAKAREDWDAAEAEVGRAREALGEAILARYKAKGKRKTLAGLKIPEYRREDTDSAGSITQQANRVRDALEETAAARKGDDAAKAAATRYTRAVLERAKAENYAAETKRREIDTDKAWTDLMHRTRYGRTPEQEAQLADLYKVKGAAYREAEEARRRLTALGQEISDARADLPAGGGGRPFDESRGQIGSGRDLADDLIAEAKADLDPAEQERFPGFSKGETPLAKANSQGWGRPEDFVLGEIVKAQGWRKPAIGSRAELDKAIQDGGVEMWRGVRPSKAATAAEQLRAMRDDDEFTPGSGIYGNGIYFSVAEDVADAFAVRDPDAPKSSATTEGAKVRAVLNPQAKIVDYDDLVKEAQGWRASGALREVPALRDYLNDPGRYAAMRGYDAIRVRNQQDGHFRKNDKGRKVRSKDDQYVILNRGAMLMEEDPT